MQSVLSRTGHVSSKKAAYVGKVVKKRLQGMKELSKISPEDAAYAAGFATGVGLMAYIIVNDTGAAALSIFSEF